jgi:hypothetical protein
VSIRLLLHYSFKLASQPSKTGKLLGSIVMKMIPIPALGRELATPAQSGDVRVSA